MREEEANWFSKWEEDLPSPEELMPLSQSLITPDLALAFDIRTPINASNHNPNTINNPQSPLPNQPNQNMPISMPNLGGSGPLAAPSSAEFAADSGELGSGGATGDEPARTLKRPRLVWTPQLHKRFVDAVAHLGIKNAVPKTIMQLMSVDGLTRENVASHLQKYRLYLKRMQGLSGGAGGGGAGAGGNGGGGGGGLVAAADPATEHLFASGPVPPHFLHPGGGRGSSEHFMPYVPVAALQHQQQQMVAAAAAAAAGQHPQYHRPMGGGGHYGQFEHAFMARQGVHRMGAPMHSPMQNYVEDLESGNAHGGRKVLTLFPTGDE